MIIIVKNVHAIIDDISCEYPLVNFDCDGNCLITLDCNGECGGDAIIDECGECGGDGPDNFIDCDGNCLLDGDNDGVCDQVDNCLEDFNPNQIDNDGDGYGDECSCQYLDIFGEITVEAGSYHVYTFNPQTDNMVAWLVDGGNIAWNSSEEPSVGVQWLDVGLGVISVVQYYGNNETCVIELPVTVTPSTIDLAEVSNKVKKIVIFTDFLGKATNMNNSHYIYIYDDGTVEKVYKLN